MTIVQSVLLGILQGIAEFLPISSSGHLAVAQSLFGLDDVPLLYDVMLHLATLLAVFIYFRRKIFRLFKILFIWIFRKPYLDDSDPDDFLSGSEERGKRTIVAVILTSLVTAVLGVLTSKMIPELSVKFTCAGFLATSLLLVFSYFMEKRSLRLNQNRAPKDEKGISALQALFIGFMQGVGTLPGISRSGSTIAGAQLCGVNRTAAGEYSFIASIPAILGAFILEAKDLGEVSSSVGLVQVIAGCVSAFVFGYLALAFLMNLIKKGKLVWFVCYLVPLGILGMIFLK